MFSHLQCVKVSLKRSIDLPSSVFNRYTAHLSNSFAIACIYSIHIHPCILSPSLLHQRTLASIPRVALIFMRGKSSLKDQFRNLCFKTISLGLLVIFGTKGYCFTTHATKGVLA